MCNNAICGPTNSTCKAHIPKSQANQWTEDAQDSSPQGDIAIKLYPILQIFIL